MPQEDQSKTANERVQFHKAKRRKNFALISNYSPLQASVGDPASSPRLIALVKTFYAVLLI